jgi:hypothetical protein
MHLLPQEQEPARRWRPMLQRPVMMQLLRLKMCNSTTLLAAGHLPCRHDRARTFYLQWLLVRGLELRELRLPLALVLQAMMVALPAARSAQAEMQTRSVSARPWPPRAQDS